MLLFVLVPLAVLGVLSTALVVFLLGVPLVTLPHGKAGHPRKLMAGRYTAPPPPTDVVAIIVGLQIRQLWRVTEWVPVVIANLSLLHGLSKGVGGEGFLSSQLFVGNPLINIQYWRSFDDLIAYSRRPANQHFVRWVKFSQKLKAGNVKSIGLYHEVYKAQPGTFEAIYLQMEPTGLGLACGMVKADTDSTAAQRLEMQRPGTPQTYHAH